MTEATVALLIRKVDELASSVAELDKKVDGIQLWQARVIGLLTGVGLAGGGVGALIAQGLG